MRWSRDSRSMRKSSFWISPPSPTSSREVCPALDYVSKVIVTDLGVVNGVHYYQLDVTDFEAIESTAATIRREHGDPTMLVNNTGIGESRMSPNSRREQNLAANDGLPCSHRDQVDRDQFQVERQD